MRNFCANTREFAASAKLLSAMRRNFCAMMRELSASAKLLPAIIRNFCANTRKFAASAKLSPAMGRNEGVVNKRLVGLLNNYLVVSFIIKLKLHKIKGCHAADSYFTTCCFFPFRKQAVPKETFGYKSFYIRMYTNSNFL